MNKFIIVNATALDRSGALNILRQFVGNIPQDSRRWLIFVSPTISIESSNTNVRIEPIKGVKPMYRRLWWDCFGLKLWLKKNEIEPLAKVSLQNTGFNVGKDVPSYIYYHQSLPFFTFNWHPLKKKERIFWFYKNIYPFLVKPFLKNNTKIFVQLEFVKRGFSKRFRHPERLIEVYSPSVIFPKGNTEIRQKNPNLLKLLYPAMPHFYKNHRVIDEALKCIRTNLSVLFTIPQDEVSFHDGRIHLIGLQPYEAICELYYSCDALIFPSYIETFGLPLLEAALTGMPIIAADLPYAREVLSGYEGVTFVPYDSPKEWASAIESVRKGKRFTPIDISGRPGWKELFKSINI